MKHVKKRVAGAFTISLLFIYVLFLASQIYVRHTEDVQQMQPPVSPIGNFVELPEATQFLSKRNESREAFFYTETTGSGVVKGRFVCALESAARAHPDADIYLLMVYSPKHLSLEKNLPLHNVLKHYSNVHVLYVKLGLLFENSPFEPCHFSGVLEKTKYKAAHTSDAVRFLVLWKYGGKYFDLDVILTRSLAGIHKFVIPMIRNAYVLASIAAYPKNSEVGYNTLNTMCKTFNGDDWQHNGPNVFTDVMTKYCGVPVLNITKENCNGFVLLNYDALFPIQYFELPLYYEENNAKKALKRIQNQTDLFGLHIGNNLSKNYKVNVGSKSAYSILAQTYCPRAYWGCFKQF